MVWGLSQNPIPAVQYNKKMVTSRASVTIFLFPFPSGLGSICIDYLFKISKTIRLSYHYCQYQFVQHLELLANQAFA
jgi:hypothetical protein